MSTRMAQLVVRVQAMAQNFDKTRAEVEKQTRGMGDATQRSQSRIDAALKKIGGAFLTVGKRIAQAGIATVIGGIAVSLKKGWDRLTGIENARASLEGLGHSGKEVDSIMKAALGSVRGTAFGMDEAAQAAATVVAASGATGAELERILTVVADSAVIGKTSMTEMASIFNKVASSGRVTTEVMNQLSDRGIGSFAILAEHLGVTQDKVREMVTKGEIDFETFATAMETKMGGAAKNAGNTVQGALANVGAAFGRVGANILSGAFSKLPEMLQGVITWFEPLEEKASVLGERLGTWLTGAIEKLQTGFARIKPVLGTLQSGFSRLWEALGGVIERIRETTGSVEIDVWGSLRDVIGQLAGVLFDAANWLDRNADSIANVVTWVKENKNVLIGLVGAYVSYRATIAAVRGIHAAMQWAKMAKEVGGLGISIAKTTGRWAANTAVIAKNIALGTGRAIRKIVTELGRKTAALAASRAGWVKDTAAQVANKAVNAGKWIGALAVTIGKKTAALAASTAGWVKDTAVMVAHKTASIAVTVATKAMAVAQRVLNAVMRANPIGLIITGILLLVAGLVKLYRENETFRRIVQAVWEAVKGAVLAVVNWFKDTAVPFLQRAWERIKTGFSSIWETVKVVWDNIKRGVSVGIEFVKNLFLNFTGPGLIIKHWDTIKRTFFAGVDYVRNLVNTWVARIVGFFVNLATGARDAVTNARNWVVDRITDLRNKATTIATNARDWVVDKFKGLAGGVRDAARNAKDWFGEQFDKIKSKASKPVEFVVNTVYNNGIRSVWNKVADKFNLATLPQLAFQGFARGGYTGPGNTYDEAGVVHRDEFVVRKQARKRFEDRFPGYLSYINDKGTLPGYAAGGRVVAGTPRRHTSGYPWATYAADFPAGYGGTPPVWAWKDGVVSLIRHMTTSYGKHIRINHDDGTSSLYAHLSKILAFVGQRVFQGQQIGNVGWTGNVRPRGPGGAHLHFETMGGPYLGGASGMSGSAQASVPLFSSLQDMFGDVLSKLSQIEDTGWGKLVAGVPRGITSALWDKIKPSIFAGDDLKASGTLRFDNGGMLPPGFSLTENRTGRPEPVFTADQWEILEAALLGGTGGDIYISLDGREYKKIAREEARVEVRRQRREGANR